MATKNEHTGQEIKSRASTKEYRDNFDRIFRSQNPMLPPLKDEPKKKAEVTE